MADGEPTWKAAVLRGAVVIVAFVGGVVLFAPPKPRPPSSFSSPPTSTPTPACDVGQRQCRVAFDGHHGMTLSLGPQPVQPASPLVVEAGFDGAASNPRVTFSGTAMSMPPTTLALLPRGHGSFVGRGTLPVCTEAVMTWTARVDVELDGEPHSATFSFVTRRAAPSGAVASVVDGGVDVGRAGERSVDVDVDVAWWSEGPPVDVTLSSADRAVTLSSLRGNVVLVAFGFTSCPDVCPTTLQAWTAARRALSPAEQARVRGLFISVDPARDSAAHVAQYAAYFDPAWVGATGSRAQIDTAVSVFGAFYAVRTAPGVDAGADYGVDHSVFTWVVDPAGRIVARLPHGAATDVTVGVLRRALSSRSP